MMKNEIMRTLDLLWLANGAIAGRTTNRQGANAPLLGQQCEAALLPAALMNS